MLSALVCLPRGASRTLLVKELRRLKVRVVEHPDAKATGHPVDFVIVGSDAAHVDPLRKVLASKRSRPPVIMVQTSHSLHESTGYDKEMWCLHRPVQPCLLRAYVRSILERKKLSDRLESALASLKNTEEHAVDDLWFAVLERLKGVSRK